MTREEAIKWLKDHHSIDLNTQDDEAHRMAIEALEQKPCEDAVSVASVFEIMGSLLSIPYDFDRSITEKDVSESMDKIRVLPRVTPQESRKGHWEVVSDGYSDNAYICECSECKDTVWVYKDADRKWNYCPNCGADMREVSE